MLTLSVSATALSLLPLCLAAAMFYLNNGSAKDIGIAGARMILQLVAVGYALAFIFDYDWPSLGILIITAMMLIASFIAIRPIKRRSAKLFRHIFVAIFLGSLVNLGWVIFIVLQLKPWYQPHFVIPLAGMVLSSGMNSISIAGERLESELESNDDEAYKKAFNAAMISQINSLLAVGLVSLPGMMTGQILAGMSPLIAVRYQIMVMSMFVGTSSVSVSIYLYFAKSYYALDRN